MVSDQMIYNLNAINKFIPTVRFMLIHFYITYHFTYSYLHDLTQCHQVNIL